MASSKALCFLLFVAIFSVSAFAAEDNEAQQDPGLVLNFYKDTCPQAEDIIREQVKLLYKRHKNTAFSWLRNLFHDCFVQSCDASLLLDSTRTVLSEKETDRSFGMRNFRYLEEVKEAVERECPGVVSCADILVLSARDGIELVGGPHIQLKTGRRDGRRSRAEILEQYLPDHNESLTVVLERFASIGIDTKGVVALLGAHSVGRTHCVKLVHRLYPEVDPSFPADHVEHMLKKCPDAIPDPKAVQYVRNDRGTPMKLDNNYYRNILDNKGLLLVDYQLANDKRTLPLVKKMAKSQDYFFQEFARAITILSENNPLTGTKGEIRRQCNVANKLHHDA
ncbi:OLC1v1021197C1 [Oldenlandia corymbosa var. corymbosa]|uniref:Peroxidase n=1 Tax=Oldenlandia corymbosa var. corymbosa TaxID=529605 RepID=A0AAV1BVR5_OLDCO|nr:OLC1v1021197C1 [Oldenlandia corymbosa var. corymbosa]